MLLIIAALLAGQSATTTCQTHSGITTCDTRDTGIQPSVPPTDYSSRMAQIDTSGLDTLAANVRANKGRKARKKVGKLIAAGQCDEAVSVALNAGDLSLASQARSFCRR